MFLFDNEEWEEWFVRSSCSMDSGSATALDGQRTTPRFRPGKPVVIHVNRLPSGVVNHKDLMSCKLTSNPGFVTVE